jgi:hypothetical protein
MQPAGFPGMMPYQPQAYQPAPRPAPPAPQRQQTAAPKPPPRPPATWIHQPEPVAPVAAAARPVDVPSPEQLGIRLEEPAVVVVVPEPEKLGINLR